MSPASSIFHRLLVIGTIAVTWPLSLSNSTGAVMVHGTAIPISGAFHYEFVVTNTGPEDIILVSIADAPLDDPLIDSTLTAPPAFLALYDPGLGIVDFLEFTDLFAAGTATPGFSFDSVAGPGAFFTTFEAFTTEADFLTGDIAITLLPGDPGSVPDGGAGCFLLGLALLGLGAFRSGLRSNSLD